MQRVLWLVAIVAGCSRPISFPTDSEWPAQPTPAWASMPRFVVTDNLSDTVSFVSADAASPALYGDVPVGDIPVELEGPHHLAASPDGRFVYLNLSNYVPGTGSGPHGAHGTGNVPGSLLKIDARTGEELGEVLVDRNPGDVILSADGQTAFVSHYDLLRLQQQLTTGAPAETGYSAIAVVDTVSMSRLALLPTCPTAHGEGLSADGGTLYVTCAQSDELAILDVRDRTHPMLVNRLPVGPTPGPVGTPSYGPYALTVSPADGTVWISDNNAGDVRVYDPAAAAMDATKTVFVGGIAMFSAFTKDGTTLYVPHQGDDAVTAIDVATKQTRLLALPQDACLNAHALTIAPSEATAVMVCEGDHVKKPGTVVYLSLPTFVMTGYVQVGMFPDGAAWLPGT